LEETTLGSLALVGARYLLRFRAGIDFCSSRRRAGENSIGEKALTKALLGRRLFLYNSLATPDVLAIVNTKNLTFSVYLTA
jgi:hypothetical protein